jgi:hypothetical protein
MTMHIDEEKKFDVRNLERNIKSGVSTQKDYAIYLSKLPDASDKVFNPLAEEPESADEMELRKKEGKKKTTGKRK